VERELQRLLGQRDRPAMRDVRAALGRYCARRRQPCPSRATLYNAIARARPPRYPMQHLPDHVRATLFNLADDAVVPGERVVLCAFNHGGTRALSFAANLPWLCLHRAATLSGWRPKSLALLRAVMRERGI
jgi:hypothetical protein